MYFSEARSGALSFPNALSFALRNVTLLLLGCSLFAAASADGTITLRIDEDINGDGVINRAELQGQIDVSVMLDDRVVAGDEVVVVGGATTRTSTVDANHLIEQRVPFAFNPPVDGEVLSFAATLRNSSDELLSETAMDIRTDLTAVAKPSISILADQDDSGFLSASEHAERLTVRVTLPADVSVSDTVYLDHGSGNLSLVLTPLSIADGMVDFTVPVASEGETLSVVASIVDEAGNRSDSGSDSVLVDTVAPLPPTVTPQISASAVPILGGELPADADYVLAVTLNEQTYVSADAALSVLANGRWQLDLPAGDALVHGIYDVTVTVTDIAGNAAVDVTTDELTIDLQAPAIAVDEIAPASDAAPIISGTTDNTDTGLVTVQTELGEALCAAPTDQGSWSCGVKKQLTTGANQLIAAAVDAAGNRAELPFTVQVVFTSDSDNDGIADDIEGTVDTDGDTVSDYLDLDSDNDGITDLVEGMIDSDADGLRDYIDTDSDNDGIDDSTEVSGRQIVISPVVGVNGIADTLESAIDSGIVAAPIDSDGDSREDFRDVDSDNDGITDRVEMTRPPNLELFDAFDTDSDGLANYIDLDSDHDGITDITEQQLSDENADAVVDNFVDLDLNGLHDALDQQQAAVDLDRDGIGNFIDLDSDGDGRRDIVELGGQDTDFDGRHDSLSDENSNAIIDSLDVALTGGADVDDDGIDDRFDADFGRGADRDDDGVLDPFDDDADGNGLADSVVLPPQLELLAQVYSFQPTAGAGLTTGTGVLGSGCVLQSGYAINEHRLFDPLLFVLLVIAHCALWRKRLGTFIIDKVRS